MTVARKQALFDLKRRQASRYRTAHYLERMDAKSKAQLAAKLERLASNPGEMSGVKPMAGDGRDSIECVMGICVLFGFTIGRLI